MPEGLEDQVYRALLFWIVLSWPSQSSAGLTCDDMPTILRVLESASIDAPNQAALRTLYADVQRLQWRVSEPATGTATPTEDFARIILLLASDARRQATSELMDRLQDPRSQSMLVAQAGMLVRRGCQDEATVLAHADRVKALATAAPEDNSPLRTYIAAMSADQKIVFVSLCILAASALYLLKRLYEVHLNMSSNRITRFPCRIPCHFEVSGQDIAVTMLNINIHGALLQSGGTDQLGVGQVANLAIGFRSIATRIERREDNQIAIQFESALKPRILFDIIEESKLIAEEQHPTIKPKRPSRVSRA